MESGAQKVLLEHIQEKIVSSYTWGIWWLGYLYDRPTEKLESGIKTWDEAIKRSGYYLRIEKRLCYVALEGGADERKMIQMSVDR